MDGRTRSRDGTGDNAQWYARNTGCRCSRQWLYRSYGRYVDRHIQMRSAVPSSVCRRSWWRPRGGAPRGSLSLHGTVLPQSVREVEVRGVVIARCEVMFRDGDRSDDVLQLHGIPDAEYLDPGGLRQQRLLPDPAAAAADGSADHQADDLLDGGASGPSGAVEEEAAGEAEGAGDVSASSSTDELGAGGDRQGQTGGAAVAAEVDGDARAAAAAEEHDADPDHERRQGQSTGEAEGVVSDEGSPGVECDS